MVRLVFLIYASHSFALVVRKESFNQVAFEQNFTRQEKMEYGKIKELEELKYDVCMIDLTKKNNEKKYNQLVNDVLNEKK